MHISYDIACIFAIFRRKFIRVFPRHHNKNAYNADEVAEIFTVPLKFFMETEPAAYVNTVRLLPPDNFPYEQIPGGRNYHWRDGHKKVYFYYYKDWIIWGLTAYVLRGVMRTLKAELPGIECGNLVV